MDHGADVLVRLREHAQAEGGACAVTPAAVQSAQQVRAGGVPLRALQVGAEACELGGGEEHEVERLGDARGKGAVGLGLEDCGELAEDAGAPEHAAEAANDEGATLLQQRLPALALEALQQRPQHNLKVSLLLRNLDVHQQRLQAARRVCSRRRCHARETQLFTGRLMKRSTRKVGCGRLLLWGYCGARDRVVQRVATMGVGEKGAGSR